MHHFGFKCIGQPFVFGLCNLILSKTQCEKLVVVLSWSSPPTFLSWCEDLKNAPKAYKSYVNKWYQKNYPNTLWQNFTNSYSFP
jgi:hypothetical protein